MLPRKVKNTLLGNRNPENRGFWGVVGILTLLMSCHCPRRGHNGTKLCRTDFSLFHAEVVPAPHSGHEVQAIRRILTTTPRRLPSRQLDYGTHFRHHEELNCSVTIQLNWMISISTDISLSKRTILLSLSRVGMKSSHPFEVIHFL